MSVGSLTTTFTPPPSCLESFSTTALTTTTITSSGSTFTDPYFLVGPWTTQGCMPDNFQFSSTNYYSPGICPVGYTSACGTPISGTVTEATVTCCPTSYACNTNVVDPWQSTYGCQSIFTTAVFPSLVVFSGSPVSVFTKSTSIGYTGAVNAFSIQIRSQSTDFQSSQPPQTSTLSSSTTTPTVSSSTTTPTVSSSTTASTSSNSDASGGGGISTGAAAGIVVGTMAGAFLLIGAFVFVYNSGRKRGFIEQLPFYGPLKQDNAPDNTIIPKAELPVPEMRVPGTTVPEMLG